MDKYDNLKLDNQLCFPLYAAAKEIVRKYKPMLDDLNLTYTQYITMMVLWERKSANVKELGSYLYLDSGTLTPLLKKLESKGYIKRTRMASDERNLLVEIQMGNCINMAPEEMATLYKLLHKVLENTSK